MLEFRSAAAALVAIWAERDTATTCVERVSKEVMRAASTAAIEACMASSTVGSAGRKCQ